MFLRLPLFCINNLLTVSSDIKGGFGFSKTTGVSDKKRVAFLPYAKADRKIIPPNNKINLMFKIKFLENHLFTPTLLIINNY